MVALVVISSEFAATNRSRPTSSGRKLCAATSPKTVPTPVSSTTAYNWPMVSVSAHQASGIDAYSTARDRSAATITVRRGDRSTHTPAGSPISRNAAVLSTASRPTCPGVAASTDTASTGTAR